MTSLTFNPNILHYLSLASTNEELKHIAEKSILPNMSVVIADAQTKGRGQAGNSWESEDGKNLTFSILIYPNNVEIINQFLLSKMVSVAIAEVLSEIVIGTSIKWPNDIYVSEKKICGILIENSIMGHTLSQTIIGIGLNVNQLQFLSDAPNPTSIANEKGVEVDKEWLLMQLLARINHYNEALNNGHYELISKSYFNHLYRKNGFHNYSDESGDFEAEIMDVLDYGYLILRDKTGKNREYAFKEVRFI